MRFLQCTRSVSRFQRALLAVYSTCMLILAADAQILPIDEPEGPWLSDSIDIIGKDIEKADLPDHDTDSDYFAYVTDIDSGTVLRKAFVGQAWIGTDNAFHIAYPRWRPDCSEVWIRDTRYLEPVTFVFGGDGDAATGPVRGQE